VAAALRLLSDRFGRVVWLPGNHEAWLRPGSRDAELYTDSFAKLLALRQVRDCLLGRVSAENACYWHVRL
jgi:hypothetical protein